ncbi:MAG: zinc-ribbon domain-containing protein [Candidatus Thermoplasmatota archaeon]|nr:zinc-ribbon domain-containing protein [Candidatus Thermoplasmatota archaeon]
MSKKSIVGVMSLVLVIIFITIALGGTWWRIEREGKFAGGGEYQKSSGNWKLIEGEGIEETSNGTFKTVVKHDIIRNNPGYDDTVRVYDTVLYLMMASLIFTIISLVMFLAAYIGNIEKPYKVGVILLIITIILVAVAPIYFVFALPQAIIKDTQDVGGSSPIDSFIGSKEVDGIKTSWGPGYAWYLTIIAFIFLIFTLIVALLEKKTWHISLKRKDKKQEELLQGDIQNYSIMVTCPYCKTSFQITPTKKPFKIKCPKCGKVSLLR